MKKRKQSITKPKFGSIFIFRFLIWCVVFLTLGAFAIMQLEDYIWSHRIEAGNAYRQKVIDKTELLYNTDPDDEGYIKALNELRLALALYQMIDYNYAEVTIGDMRFATDEDTCIFLLREGENRQFFFIDDMSYLDPVNEFMDGRFDLREYNEWVAENSYDAFALIAYDMGYNYRDYNLLSAYIDRGTGAFIPGRIEIVDNHGTYEVDCTPADTRGYEYVELNPENHSLYMTAFRMAQDSSPADIVSYVIPNDNGGTREVGADEISQLDVPWRAGFSELKYLSAWKIAPGSLVCIIIIAIASAAVVSLVLSVVRYQRDKTVWEIFEYRRKTTEAMAHDLKTPLASIMAYAESIESSAGDADKTGGYARKISENVRSMDHMIEDMLSLSGSESGMKDIVKEEVGLKGLLMECLEACPDIKVRLTGKDMTLMTDRKVLRQALDNLLSNSLKHGLKGGTVDITIGSGTLTVTNETDKTYDDVNSLKKPFVKGDDSRGSRGSGLGLSIAENDLNLLGYRLELSSEEGVFSAVIVFDPHNK